MMVMSLQQNCCFATISLWRTFFVAIFCDKMLPPITLYILRQYHQLTSPQICNENLTIANVVRNSSKIVSWILCQFAMKIWSSQILWWIGRNIVGWLLRKFAMKSWPSQNNFCENKLVAIRVLRQIFSFYDEFFSAFSLEQG